MDAKEMLANLTGAPECDQFGIVAAGWINEAPGYEDQPVRFVRFHRIVTYKDGTRFHVLVEEVCESC